MSPSLCLPLFVPHIYAQCVLFHFEGSSPCSIFPWLTFLPTDYLNVLHVCYIVCPTLRCPIISTLLVYLRSCAPFVPLSDCCGRYVLVLLFLALSCCSLWFLLFFQCFSCCLFLTVFAVMILPFSSRYVSPLEWFLVVTYACHLTCDLALP